MLIATPFVGAGGWPADEFELPTTSARGCHLAFRSHLFHGPDDDTAPPAHADLYAKAIPQAQLHLLPGRDHQLGNDLTEVAAAIQAFDRPIARR